MYIDPAFFSDINGYLMLISFALIPVHWEKKPKKSLAERRALITRCALSLLDMTAQVLAQEHSQPQLIVLHLMGSHPQACDRTQGKYETFVQSKETSCYLYTMTQTDDLLRKLYDQLRNSGSSFSLVYFSDHGLAFKERGKDVQYLAHDDKYQQNFQVPFMVISSEKLLPLLRN